MTEKITDKEGTLILAFFLGCLFALIVTIGVLDLWAYWITGLPILVVW